MLRSRRAPRPRAKSTCDGALALALGLSLSSACSNGGIAGSGGTAGSGAGGAICTLGGTCDASSAFCCNDMTLTIDAQITPASCTCELKPGQTCVGNAIELPSSSVGYECCNTATGLAGKGNVGLIGNGQGGTCYSGQECMTDHACPIGEICGFSAALQTNGCLLACWTVGKPPTSGHPCCDGLVVGTGGFCALPSGAICNRGDDCASNTCVPLGKVATCDGAPPTGTGGSGPSTTTSSTGPASGSSTGTGAPPCTLPAGCANCVNLTVNSCADAFTQCYGPGVQGGTPSGGPCCSAPGSPACQTCEVMSNLKTLCGGCQSTCQF